VLPITLFGHAAVLHPSGALELPALRTLLIADAHFGKSSSFRALGVPVPSGTTTENLNLLTQLLASTQAQRIIFLGDFLHSASAHAASTQGAIAAWRAQHAGITLTLVRGNHDAHAGDPPAALKIDVVDEPLILQAAEPTAAAQTAVNHAMQMASSSITPDHITPTSMPTSIPTNMPTDLLEITPSTRPPGPLALCHHPQRVPGAYVLAGHWHPCITVQGRGRDRLRLPCFWLGDEAAHPVGILPAFGSFTGMHPIDRREGLANGTGRDRVFAVAGDAVRALP
jgi:uncharacterized protein